MYGYMNKVLRIFVISQSIESKSVVKSRGVQTASQKTIIGKIISFYMSH
jgi:hypothetical protein